MPLVGLYILIVRESTAWIKARPEMLKKFSNIHFRKTYQIEEQLKEDVKASKAHNDLFSEEDAIANFIALQKLRYRPPNDVPVVIRTCVPEKISEALSDFNPNWVITVGSNYTYIRACQNMYSKTSIVGINTSPHGFIGSLCFGGRFSPPLNLRLMDEYCINRYRILIETTNPGTKKIEARTYYLYAVNEIFIGNENPEKHSKGIIHLCHNGRAMETRFKEILMMTGSGYNFRMLDRRSTETAIGKYLDIHRDLDKKTANRVADFSISKISMIESSDVFAVFTKQFSKNRRNDKISGIQTRSMGLDIKSSDVLLVVDGIRKIEIPRGTTIRFIMNEEDVLKTYKKSR